MTSVSGQRIRFRGARSASGPLTWGQQWIWEEVAHFGEHHNELNFVAVSRTGEQTRLADICVGIRELVERYEILRTNFRAKGPGEAYQYVMAEGQFNVDVVEGQNNDGAEPGDGDEVTSHDFVRQMTRKPFSFEDGMPVRFIVILHDGVPASVALVFSHIAADHWSAQSLAHELEQLIDPSHPAHVETVRRRNRHQAVDQAEWEAGEEGLHRSGRAINFAARQLETFPATLMESSSAGREDPPIRDVTMASRALRYALRSVSLKYGVSDSDVLLYCVSASLSALRQNAVCGLMLYGSNRYGALQNPALGTLVQDVPIAVPTRDDSLGTALKNTFRTARAAYLHAQYGTHAMKHLVRSHRASRSGQGPDVSCSLNMLLDNKAAATEVDLHELSSADGMAALQESTWLKRGKAQARDRPGRKFYLVCLTLGDQVVLILKVDTGSVSVAAAESFLRDLEARAVHYSQLG